MRVNTRSPGPCLQPLDLSGTWNVEEDGRLILVWRSHTHEREARGSGVKLDCDLYPAAGILQSNQIAELLVTRLLRHYHYITTIITFPLEGGVWVRESSQCIIKRHLFLRHCIPLVQIAVKLDARPSRIALVGVAPPDL